MDNQVRCWGYCAGVAAVISGPPHACARTSAAAAQLYPWQPRGETCGTRAAVSSKHNMCFQHQLQGEGAKTVARALRAAGVRRAYTLSGGFKAWQNAGLGVKQVGRKEGGCVAGH